MNFNLPFNILPKVGTATERQLNKLFSGKRIIDLLLHLPNDFLVRRVNESCGEVKSGEVLTMLLTITSHKVPQNRKRPFIIYGKSKSGETIILNFFHYHLNYILQNFPIGEKRIISGKLSVFNEQRIITHSRPCHKGKRLG